MPCLNDVSFAVNVTGAANLACYRATISTNLGAYTCQTNGSGACTIVRGSGSYTDGTSVFINIERTCPLIPDGGDLGTYVFSGHL